MQCLLKMCYFHHLEIIIFKNAEQCDRTNSFEYCYQLWQYVIRHFYRFFPFMWPYIHIHTFDTEKDVRKTAYKIIIFAQCW